MLENKRICLIGAGGFIGSHVGSRLQDEGINVHIFNGDVCNFELLEAYLADMDVVINCAALANLTACLEDPWEAYDVNTMGVVNILEACRLNKIKRVVLSSSNVVYGSPSPYKSSMLAAEDVGRTYAMNYGMSVISLRYANVYGPGMRDKWKVPTIFAAFRKQLRENGHIEIMGDGSQTRNYIHVYDVVDAILTAANSDYSGILDICTDKDTSVMEIAELHKCPFVFIPSKVGDVPKIKQDPLPAKAMLGWEAKIQFEEGIKDVLT